MAKSSSRPWILIGVGLVAVVVFAMALSRGKAPSPRGAGGSTTAISVAPVERRDVAVTLDALGQAQAWQTVIVRAEVGGRLLKVPVREGSDIEQGALIAEIDPAPFRAALMQAQGALRRDQAQLDLARLKLQRFRQLADSQGIAALDVDTQAALVHQHEGAVMLAEGVVAAAKVDLDNTRVVAPVAGRVGLRLVDAGNVVTANDAGGIVTINQIAPIAVTFTVPQGDFQRLSERTDAFRRPLATEARSQETGELLGSGELTVVDNRVDPSTATVQLKARFANEAQRLWPGQLLNVRLTLETLRDALVVPAAAVVQGPSGPFAYVVEADAAVMRPVQVAHQLHDTTVVTSGVEPGERVVVEGQGSLRPGAKVAVRRP